MPKIERPTEIRSIRKDVEVRSAQTRTIGGYAACFDRPSRNLGGFIETIDQRAFRKTLGDKGPVICRFNHEDNLLLGTTRAGTLRLSTDTTGLMYEVDLPECRGDVWEMVARGDIANSSFAFEAFEDDWSAGPGGIPVRQLRSVRLIDVAPVVNPAYPDATVGLRSLAQFANAPFEEVETLSRKDELRKLFIRTDRPSERRGRSGPDALVELMRKRFPSDEADADGRPRTAKDGRQALLDVMGRRWPDDDSTPENERHAL